MARRTRQAVALEGVGTVVEQAGRVPAQHRTRRRPGPAEAHRVRQAGGRRELNAAADGPAAVQLIGCALKGVSPATWMSVQSTWNSVALTVTRSSRHERRRPTS